MARHFVFNGVCECLCVCVCVSVHALHHSINPDRQGSSFQHVLLEMKVLLLGVGVLSYILHYSIYLHLFMC